MLFEFVSILILTILTSNFGIPKTEMKIIFLLAAVMCLSAFVAAQDCGCPTIIDPVCFIKQTEVDRHFFAQNQCDFLCQQANDTSIQATDSAICCSACTLATPSPVCGSDGVTYRHMCALQCRQIEIAKSGQTLELVAEQGCKEIAPDCSAQCPAQASYICGSNGGTFLNACYLSCSQQIFKHLTLLKQGPCDGQAPANPCNCGWEQQPVCGTIGGEFSWFMNQCQFDCTKASVPELGLAEFWMCIPDQIHSSGNFMLKYDPNLSYGPIPQNPGLVATPKWLICWMKQFLTGLY